MTVKAPAPAEFETTFLPPLIHLLVQALRQAYADACRNHATSPGANAQTFGLDLYHFCNHYLAELEKRTGGAIRLVQKYPSYLFKVGDLELICLHVGNRATASIWESFPNPSNGGVHEAAKLCSQFLPGFEPDVSHAPRYVLAHLGNATDGLGAAYLTIPVESGASAGLEWAFAHAVLAPEPGATTTATPTPTPGTPASTVELHPEVPAPALTVHFLTDENAGAGELAIEDDAHDDEDDDGA